MRSFGALFRADDSHVGHVETKCKPGDRRRQSRHPHSSRHRMDGVMERGNSLRVSPPPWAWVPTTQRPPRSARLPSDDQLSLQLRVVTLCRTSDCVWTDRKSPR